MNISALGSIITIHIDNKVKGRDLFYIGTGIGLSSGLLCLCIFAHYKYYKHKHNHKQPVTHLYNDQDDITIINTILNMLNDRKIIQVV